VALRREAYEKRLAAQERRYTDRARFNHGRSARATNHHLRNETLYREALKLPLDGALDPAQIKKAFRRLAQKAHPDVGGSQELFVRITEARNALLELIS
jgi:hypothetical protein